MICLTGDIHHYIKSSDRSFTNLSEAELGKEYVEIANNFGVKVTFFITGKAFIEDWEDIKELLKFNNLQIGGHTWNALRPRFLHKIFERTIGSAYGPTFYQERDIRKTIEVISGKAKKVYCWRTHGYQSDKKTLNILEKFGIQVISDEVHKDKLGPERLKEGLISLPINVMPDHEHLYHGRRTPENVRKETHLDNFPDQSFYINEWFEIIKRQIGEIEKQNGIATLLVHPICMHTADKFETFKKLCKFISSYETVFTNTVCKFF